ncbi:hypothetical protein BJ875DRAFT_9394 [Amylocarpus encephaloides]|uniref:Uncharacterized protein n=1 Tax=Amylocarpus encephaloides TaxID=45428 RepID=A0A9P7YJ68_9HELO|nr:hypothetical protein BJ875DRAFT_9394 [Amylocarpus encephaloides]
MFVYLVFRTVAYPAFAIWGGLLACFAGLGWCLWIRITLLHGLAYPTQCGKDSLLASIDGSCLMTRHWMWEGGEDTDALTSNRDMGNMNLLSEMIYDNLCVECDMCAVRTLLGHACCSRCATDRTGSVVCSRTW